MASASSVAKLPPAPAGVGPEPALSSTSCASSSGLAGEQTPAKKPQTKADGKVMEHGEHQTATTSHCYQDMITPLVKPVITLRGQLVLMA